jgi:hypothetical protein
MTEVCPYTIFQHAPSSKKLCHSIDVCRGIVQLSESFVKVMALRMRQDFAQKLLQRRPSCAIVRSCDDRPQPRDIAQVGADAQCIRKGPGRHGGETVREVALKLSRSRHVRCNDLERLGGAELQKAAAPTHHTNLTLSFFARRTAQRHRAQKRDRRWQDSNLRSRRNKISSLAR